MEQKLSQKKGELLWNVELGVGLPKVVDAIALVHPISKKVIFVKGEWLVVEAPESDEKPEDNEKVEGDEK